MNKYLKSFLHRGLVFGGFGPVVVGIVFWILENSIENFSLSGFQVFLAIVSTYVLAFVQAGASVFNQIEEWPVAKSLLCHFASLYIAYTLCYLINTWIPFEPVVLLVFTAVFVAVYFVIWIVVYFSVKATAKRLNGKLK